MHFQGPMYLRQFAVYIPGASTSSKKAKRATMHARRHGHQAFHHNPKLREIQERAVGDIVYATVDGQLVSWTNQYSGPPATATPTVASGSGFGSVASTSAMPTDTAGTMVAPPPPIGSGAWDHVAYLNTKEAKSQSFGISFLNKLGTLDPFGLTLSYAAADGTANTATQNETPEPNYYIPSNSEIIMMSDQQCGTDDCTGALRTPEMSYRELIITKTVAHSTLISSADGWIGAEKAFFMEFSMPDDGITTPPNGNKPAIWMLNAQIPRGVQFGDADCSPWSTGGGELDVFEVLESGNPNATVTLHSNINGGGNAVFQRPTDKNSPIKFAVVFYANGAHMKILDDGFPDFGSSMAANTINEIVQSTSASSDSCDWNQLSYSDDPAMDQS